MLLSVEAIFEEGKVIFSEKIDLPKRKVIVTFLDTESLNSTKDFKKKHGVFNGLIEIPKDFDMPLEDLKDYM